MKKFQKTVPALLLVLGLSAIGFAGCQVSSNDQQQPTGIDQTPMDRRIGTLQSLGGVSTNNLGTDILTMDDGSTVLLKSLTINLDDAKYVGKRVEVSGVLTYTTDKQQLMEVQSIDVLENTTAVTQQLTATPTWRDYVNENLGFQVKYRDDFTSNENGQTITFTRPLSSQALAEMMAMTQETSSSQEMVQNHVITINVTPHDPGKSIVKDFLNLDNDNSSTLLAAGMTKSKIGLDGIDAYKEVDSHAQNVVNFSFDDGHNFYKISYQGGSDSQNLEDQTVFYDFLGSFKLSNGSTNSISSTQESGMTPSSTGSTVTGTASASVTPPATPDSSLESAIKNNQSDFNAPSTTNTSTTTPAIPSPSTSDSSSVTDSSGSNGSSTSSSTATTPTPAPSDSTSTASSTSTTSNDGSTSTTASGTQESMPGYSSFTSSGYKFSLQYPKNWYYGQTSATESDVVRRYDFGNQPVDETPGNVNLDIVSGSIPSGSPIGANGKTVTQTSTGAVDTFYYKDSNGRVYRVSGPSSMQSELLNMITTIQEQ